MTLRFHREFYDGMAVDAAVKTFEDYGSFALSETESHWIVEVSGREGPALRELAGELQNYALGLSIDQRASR